MNRELLEIMQRCGHFLYHRRGGKQGQGRILRLLDQFGSMTQKQLLEWIEIKSGSLSEIISKLQEQGLITKEQDGEDKRKYQIVLTEQGKQVVEENKRINVAQEEILFTSLTEAEQQELQRLLTKVFQDWEDKFDQSLFHHGKCKPHKGGKSE